MAKGAKDRLAFLWIALAVPIPIGIWTASTVSWSWEGLLCVFLSSVLHALYFWTLGRVYETADLSYVYPFTRGVGAATAVTAGVIFLGERPSALSWAGIVLTLGGLLLEPLGLSRNGLRVGLREAALTAFVGFLIGCYLFVDKIGVDKTSALAYLGALFIGTPICLLPFVLKGERLSAEWRVSRLNPVWGAVFMSLAYALILAAMEIAPISFVAAARSSGIVVSAFAGIFFFGEMVSRTRWAAIFVVTAGVVCLGLGR